MGPVHTIAAVGEVLWDVFPDGPRFGGAPANVACHAAALGANSWMVGRVGNDDLGAEAIQTLRQRGVNVTCVTRSDEHPTGTVQVALEAGGHPRFTIREGAAWDFLEWSDSLAQLAGRCHAVCFGTLGQRREASGQVIRQFVSSAPRDALRVLDINLRPPFVDADMIRQSLGIANVLKLSDEELDIVADSCDVTGDEAEVLAALIERFGLRLVALTRGARGSTLVGRAGRSDLPGITVEVRDTVGAGDAFTAALILGLLRGRELKVINNHAARVAAYVCSQSGATPPLPAELKLGDET